MDIYAQNILDHNKNPENFGELRNPTVISEEYNPLCGDKIKIFIVIDEGSVIDIRFNGSGCAISQAATSMLTEKLIGKTVEEASAIGKEEILKLLGVELGPSRLKCALLGWQGVQNALKKL